MSSVYSKPEYVETSSQIAVTQSTKNEQSNDTGVSDRQTYSGANSPNPTSVEDSDVTMSICPVCGFSAENPRKLDEHMDSEHGEDSHLHQTISTPKRPRLSMPQFSTRISTDLSTNTQTDEKDSLKHELEAPIFDERRNSSYSSESSFSSPSGGVENSEYLSDATNTGTSIFKPDNSRTASMNSPRTSLQADSRRRYRCSLCPATFPWHGDLTEHLRDEHGVQKSRENARGGKAGNFCCSCCKYVAKYQSELRRHMRLHWGVKPFACVFCPYRSAWKGDLKRHMESHHKECFSNEADLVKIMSQFKNNAGTIATESATSMVSANGDGETSGGEDRSTADDRCLCVLQNEDDTVSQARDLSDCNPILEASQSATRLNLKSDRDQAVTTPFSSWYPKQGSKIPQPLDATYNRTQSRSQIPITTSGTWKQSPPSIKYSEATGLAQVSEDQPAPISSLPDLKRATLETELNEQFTPSLQVPLTATSQPPPPSPPPPPPLDFKKPPQELPYMLLPQNSQLFNVISTSCMNIIPGVLPSPMFCTSELMSQLLRAGVAINPTTIPFDTPTQTNALDAIDASENVQPLNLVCNKREEASPTRPSASSPKRPPVGLHQMPDLKDVIAGFQQQFLMNHLLSTLSSDIGLTPSPELSSVAPTSGAENNSDWVATRTALDPVAPDPSPTLKRRSVIPSLQKPVLNASTCCQGGREEQWKRYQCSGCGHRSNWKWDINKHIKVAHPERKGITTITMDLEEARLTLPAYLDKLKGLRNRNCRFISSQTPGSETDQTESSAVDDCASPGEGYYRPFKCSVCGHRSNWKWDVKKHIKQMHGGSADVISLSLEEARRTIHQYKTHRRQGNMRHSIGALQSTLASRLSVSSCEGETSQTRSDEWNLGGGQSQVKPTDTSFLSDKPILTPMKGEPVTEAVCLVSEAALIGTSHQQSSTSPSCPSGYRCSACKRRFHTWSSLHFHSIFHHTNAKRSYKKNLLQKALSSPSAWKTSPLKDVEDSETDAVKALPFTALEVQDISQTQYRKKVQARRSLIDTVRAEATNESNFISPTPVVVEPLKSSDIGNRTNNVTSSDSSRAVELAALLERVLMLIETTNDGSSHLSMSRFQPSDRSLIASLSTLSQGQMQRMLPVVPITEAGPKDIQNTSNEENNATMDSDNNSETSERVLGLLLQPQIQPLLNKLSILLQTIQQKTSQAQYAEQE